jgi:hypothetical protein
VGLNPAGFTAANADVNRDGADNIVDALMIAQYYVGLLSSLGCFEFGWWFSRSAASPAR